MINSHPCVSTRPTAPGTVRVHQKGTGDVSYYFMAALEHASKAIRALRPSHIADGRAPGRRRSCGRGGAGAALTCFEWNRAKFETGDVFYTPDMAQESPGYAALPLRAITHHPPHTRPCAGLAALMRLGGCGGGSDVSLVESSKV